MSTRTANILRLDNIKVAEFINAVNLTLESTNPKVLLPDRKLSDIRLDFNRITDSELQYTESRTLKYQLYLMVEDELLNRTRDRYIALVADASEENNLIALAFQIRDILQERNIPGYLLLIILIRN